MYVSQLGLVNFRNYPRLGVRLLPGATVFQGDNGQGKTNLLEAVYFLATTRSVRASSDRELVSWWAGQDGPPFARIEARVQRRGGELHLEVLLREEAPGTGDEPPSLVKSIKVNGLPIRASQLVGQLNVVLFSPEDVGLLTGPPAARRRYLDITNSQVNHLYLRALQRFHRVLSQRNHLLRQIRERRQPLELLELWTDELVAEGEVVIRQRLEMLDAINRAIGGIFRELVGSGQELRLAYTSTATPGEVASAELASAYRERLVQVRSRELDQGVTLVGPHRDDFSCLVDGVDVGSYGSRGQQRLAVLALKLAEAEYMCARTEEEPILLLDDILSELDAARRELVLARVADAGQSLITTADRSAFGPSFLARASIHRVQGGALSPECRVPDPELSSELRLGTRDPGLGPAI